MALIGDTFYVGNTDCVMAFPYAAGADRITAPGKRLTTFKPSGHWTRSLLPSADGKKLYVGVGSLTNIADEGMAVEEGRAAVYELDLANGTASPDKPGEHMAHYTVPLKPMLGCVATAVGPAQAPPGTGDSGYFGGNMDFNEITEGATVYLPVSNVGALLYLGDGHAAQGDGELNGNALETSMDVEFTVDVIPEKRASGPRVENATSIMAMGLGSVDYAVKGATSTMASWLADDNQLTPSEVAQVLGTATHYTISELADRNAGVVLKLDKARLQTLTAGAK
jgi:acetamidase/formamidase